jgi:hypothetical protein
MSWCVRHGRCASRYPMALTRRTPDQICPAVLPRQKRPLNRVSRSPGRPLVERRPVKFLAADRVPEKYSREKGETNGLK